MGESLNKIVFLIIYFTVSVFAKNIDSLNVEEKQVIKLMYEKVLQSIIKYDKKSTLCDKYENKNILNPTIFKNLEYSDKKLKKILYYLWYDAKERCYRQEKNELAINFYKYKMLVKEYDIDDKYTKIDYLKYFTIGTKIALKDEIEYLELTDRKLREYFESIDELNQPFNFKESFNMIINNKN